MKHKPSLSHEEVMVKKLRNRPQFAAEYLAAALENTDEPEVFLIALRHIAEARGGLAKVAKAAGIKQELLRRILFGSRTPRFATIMPIINAMGLKLTLKPIHPTNP